MQSNTQQRNVQRELVAFIRQIQKRNLQTFKKSIERKSPNPPGKKYCGTDLLLPDGYSRYGTRYECLKKGIGVGLLIAEEKLKNIYS